MYEYFRGKKVLSTRELGYKRALISQNVEEGRGGTGKRRRWRRHHKVWQAPFAIDLSPLAAILRSGVPHHASPWNTILFPLGRPLVHSVGERVSPLYLCVFAHECAHMHSTHHLAYVFVRICIYIYINTVVFVSMGRKQGPPLTPAFNDTVTSRAMQHHPCQHHRCNHLPDTYPDVYTQCITFY